MTEKNKQFIKVTSWIIVLAGVGFWLLHSSQKNNNTNAANTNTGDTQTSRAATAIADFKEKYQAADTWQQKDWTIKTQIALLKEPTPIVFQADLDDVFTNDKDIIVRAHISSGLFNEDYDSNSYYLDLRCNNEDIVNKVISQKPKRFGNQYVVAAKLTELGRPMLTYGATLDNENEDGPYAYINIDSSDTYIGKGDCLDFTSLE